MNPESQRAQDMLAAMQAQRDNALNAMVIAQAEIAALRREVARLTPSETAPRSDRTSEHQPDTPLGAEPAASSQYGSDSL